MVISGDKITTFSAKIKDDFSPKTTYALRWAQMSNGFWYCTDRGVTADMYDADIRLYGIESVINNFINEIELNRQSENNILTLSDFNSQEHIFGADVNYSDTLICTPIMQRRVQGSWKGFGLPLRLSLLSPGFLGGVGSLPIFRLLDVGYDADSDYTINKYDAYSRIFSYQDHNSDSGSFTGIFTFSDEEMIALRRYIATNRGNKIPMPTFSGVAYPFGRRTPGTTANIVYFEDMGMLNMNSGVSRWKTKITIAEDV